MREPSALQQVETWLLWILRPKIPTSRALFVALKIILRAKVHTRGWEAKTATADKMDTSRLADGLMGPHGNSLAQAMLSTILICICMRAMETGELGANRTTRLAFVSFLQTQNLDSARRRPRFRPLPIIQRQRLDLDDGSCKVSTSITNRTQLVQQILSMNVLLQSMQLVVRRITAASVNATMGYHQRAQSTALLNLTISIPNAVTCFNALLMMRWIATRRLSKNV
eukprot:SAG31_NODE_249_length_19118_cov_47.456195_20_plen_226_part_00